MCIIEPLRSYLHWILVLISRFIHLGMESNIDNQTPSTSGIPSTTRSEREDGPVEDTEISSSSEDQDTDDSSNEEYCSSDNEGEEENVFTSYLKKLSRKEDIAKVKEQMTSDALSTSSIINSYLSMNSIIFPQQPHASCHPPVMPSLSSPSSSSQQDIILNALSDISSKLERFTANIPTLPEHTNAADTQHVAFQIAHWSSLFISMFQNPTASISSSTSTLMSQPPSVAQPSVAQPSVQQPSIPQPPVLQPSVPQPPVLQPSVPQPSIPQPSVPQPSIPQPSVPQPSIPQLSITQPSVPQPSIPQLSIPQPSVPQPSVPQPPVPQPSIPQSSVPQPSVPQPPVPQPSVPQPSVPQPSVPQPSVPQPPVPQPSVPQPSVPQPPVPQPSVPQPSVPQPSIPQLSIPQPSVPQPSVPQPSIPQSSVPQPSSIIDKETVKIYKEYGCGNQIIEEWLRDLHIPRNVESLQDVKVIWEVGAKNCPPLNVWTARMRRPGGKSGNHSSIFNQRKKVYNAFKSCNFDVDQVRLLYKEVKPGKLYKILSSKGH